MKKHHDHDARLAMGWLWVNGFYVVYARHPVYGVNVYHLPGGWTTASSRRAEATMNKMINEVSEK